MTCGKEASTPTIFLLPCIFCTIAPVHASISAEHYRVVLALPRHLVSCMLAGLGACSTIDDSLSTLACRRVSNQVEWVLINLINRKERPCGGHHLLCANCALKLSPGDDCIKLHSASHGKSLDRLSSVVGKSNLINSCQCEHIIIIQPTLCIPPLTTQ